MHRNVESQHNYSLDLIELERIGEHFYSWLRRSSNRHELYCTEIIKKSKFTTRLSFICNYLKDHSFVGGQVDNLSSEHLYLLWSLWKDKSFAIQINKKNYRALQHKYFIKHSTRKNIHAGFLIFWYSHFNNNEQCADDLLLDKFTELFSKKIPYSKLLIKDYHSVKKAIINHHDNQNSSSFRRWSDTLLATAHGCSSAIMKGTASVVVLLSLGLVPPFWAAIPAFAFVLLNIYLNLLTENKHENLLLGTILLAVLAGITPTILIMPSTLWFMSALFLQFGIVAGTQSYRVSANACNDSRRKTRNGGIFHDLLYKLNAQGVFVKLRPHERGFLWGVAIPFSFIGMMSLSFIGYHAIMYFLQHISLFTPIATLPVTHVFVFLFVLFAQGASSITHFRHIREQSIRLSNIEFHRLGKSITRSTVNFIRRLRQKPVEMLSKSALVFILSLATLLYILVVANVVSTSFLLFVGMALTATSKVIGTMIAFVLVFPVNAMYNIKTNQKLYDACITLFSRIRNLFTKQPKAQFEMSDPITKQIGVDLKQFQDSNRNLNRVKNSWNLILNAFGKASLRMNPHLPGESIRNMAAEGVNALATGMLSFQSTQSSEGLRKDIEHIRHLASFEDLATESDSATKSLQA